MSQSTSPPKTLTSLPFAEAIHHRRSVYALTNTLPFSVTDEVIQNILTDAALHVPSAFNSQTSRMVLLVKDEHKKFWQLAGEVMKAKYDHEKWERTKGRLEGFEGAYGSVLFFESTATVKKYQDNSPAYASLFPGWSEQTSGMHQFVVWTALEAFEGVGANLQHYHYEPDVQTKAKEHWHLPEEWDMKAQLVFGGVKEGGYPTQGKEKLSTSETVRVFGA